MALIRNQKGAVVVEFALVLPLLISLVFGTIDFGLLLYNQQIITNASREGVRAGIARSTISVEDVVENYCQDRLFPKESSLSDVTVSGGGAFQNDLTVTVTYEHNFMFANIIGFSTKTLTGRTVMKMEAVPPPSSP